jgi:hypothetical protein
LVSRIFTEMNSIGLTDTKTFDAIKKAFKHNDQIAIFVDYENGCGGSRGTSATLCELNGYHDANVALIVNKNYADLDEDAKKLPVIIEEGSELGRCDSSSRYKQNESLNDRIIELVKGWYKNGPVFILVYIGNRPSADFRQLNILRRHATIKIISHSALDEEADDHAFLKQTPRATFKWLIKLARREP